jgi:hypothetical protein
VPFKGSLALGYACLVQLLNRSTAS